jgi:hypothetical protein
MDIENSENRRSDEIQTTLIIFADQIATESQQNWRMTSREALFNDIKALLGLVGHLDNRELEEGGCRMELSDREKLIKAGFRLFRMMPNQLVVQEWKRGAWEYVRGFGSHGEMQRYFNSLMKDDKYLKG